jgi:hypothetical protein
MGYCVACRKSDNKVLYLPSSQNGFHEGCRERLIDGIREADIVLGVDLGTGKTLRVIYGEALLQLISTGIEGPRVESS